MNLIPVFQNRDYTDRIIKPNVTYEVTRLSDNAIGGSKRCDIDVTGSAADCWEFVEYLGCPVTVFDDAGRGAWMGYVHEVKSSDDGATIYCRGWWERLGWRYYLNAGTNSVATTTQIAAIVTNMAPFITATDIDASGTAVPSTPETRDGKRRGREEIEELLQAGTTNSKRLLARVKEGRRLFIYEEPTSSDVDDLVFTGRVEVGASLDTMTNKMWAVWTSPGGSDSHNTASVTDADSSALYGDKSEAITLSAADSALATAARDAELARRKLPIPTVTIKKGVVSNFFGIPIPGYMVKAGQWMRLRWVIPQSVDVTGIADISKIFIEEAEWRKNGGLRITPRDIPGRYQGGNLS